MVEPALLSTDNRFDPVQGRLLTDVELATRLSGFGGEFTGGAAKLFRGVPENLAKFDFELSKIQGRVPGEGGILDTGLQAFEQASRNIDFGGVFGQGAAREHRAIPGNIERFQAELLRLDPNAIFEGSAEALALRSIGFEEDIPTRGRIDIQESFISARGLQQPFETALAQARLSIEAGGVELTGEDPNAIGASGLSLFQERQVAVDVGFVFSGEVGASFEEELQQFLNSSPGILTEFNSRINREIARQVRLFGNTERFQAAIGTVSQLVAVKAGLGFAKFATGIKAGTFIDVTAAKLAPELFAIGEFSVAESVLLAKAQVASIGGTAAEIEAAGAVAAAQAEASAAGAGLSLSGALSGAGIGFAIGSFFAPGGKTKGAQIGGAAGGAIAGATFGAKAGSIIPGIGTIVGALVGAAIGSFFGPDAPVPQSNFFAPINPDGTFQEGLTRLSGKNQGTEFSSILASATNEFSSAMGSLGFRFLGQEGTEGIFGGNLGGTANITINFPTAGINEKVDFSANDSEAISKGIVKAMLFAIDKDNSSPISTQALENVDPEGKDILTFLNEVQAEIINLAQEAGFIDEDGQVVLAGGVEFPAGENLNPNKKIKTTAEIALSQIDLFLEKTRTGKVGFPATRLTGPTGLLDLAPTRRRQLTGGVA